MPELTTPESAALWLGVSNSDPHLVRLCKVASAAIVSYLDNPGLEIDPLPPEIEQAALETVANLYRNRTTNPLVASMALGDSSVSYRDLGAFEPIPATAKALLRPYRRFRVVSSS